MASQITVTVKVKVRWWLRPAMMALMVLACITRVEPSDSVIDWLARHGVTHTVVQ